MEINEIAKGAIKRKDDYIVFNGGQDSKDFYIRDENNNWKNSAGEYLEYKGKPVTPETFK